MTTVEKCLRFALHSVLRNKVFGFDNFKIFMIRECLIMKNDDRSDLIFDDLYEPDITGMDLTDEEMKEIRKEHEQLGIED